MTTIRNSTASYPTDEVSKQQRHAVKEIASEFQSELRAYKSLTEDTLREGGGLAAFAQSVRDKRLRLTSLQNQPMSTVAPPSTIFRSVTSGATLAAAGTGRIPATVAAGAGAAVQTTIAGAVLVGYGLVSSPIGAVTGTFGGLAAGVVGGVMLPVSVLKPVTAVVGGVAGAALFGVGGAIAPLVNIPGNVVNAAVWSGSRGSLAQKAFRGIDRLAVAKAHVRHKKMSTADIAQETSALLEAATRMTEVKSRSPVREFNLNNSCTCSANGSVSI